MSKVKTETRYRALTNIEHPERYYRDADGHIRNVTVLAGEDVDLSHRHNDRIQDLINGRVVEPYEIPKGTPHVVLKEPVKEIYSKEKQTMIEVREWGCAMYQWGKYNTERKTFDYFDPTYSTWLGETDFIERYVPVPQEGAQE